MRPSWCQKMTYLRLWVYYNFIMLHFMRAVFGYATSKLFEESRN